MVNVPIGGVKSGGSDTSIPARAVCMFAWRACFASPNNNTQTHAARARNALNTLAYVIASCHAHACGSRCRRSPPRKAEPAANSHPFVDFDGGVPMRVFFCQGIIGHDGFPIRPTESRGSSQRKEEMMMMPMSPFYPGKVPASVRMSRQKVKFDQEGSTPAFSLVYDPIWKCGSGDAACRGLLFNKNMG